MGSAKEKSKRKKRHIWVPLLLTAIVILFLIIYVYPSVTGVFETTSVIEYDGIQVVDEVDAYFVRDETVYYASRAGEINYYIGEGEQVRKGTPILKIIGGAAPEGSSQYGDFLNRVAGFNMGDSLFSSDMKRLDTELERLNQELNAESQRRYPDQNTITDLNTKIAKLQSKKNHLQTSQDSAQAELDAQSMPVGSYGQTPSQYTSPCNGIISYYLDGYETEFTTENMRLLSKAKVEKLDLEHAVTNVTRDHTRINEPLYKVVQNNEWYVVFWVDQDNISKYQKDRSVTLRLPMEEVEGTVRDILEDEDYYLIVLEFNRYYEDLSQIRKLHTEVVTSDYKGLKVRNGSITTKDGETGVYVKDISGGYTFKPVKIIATDGEYSLLESSYFNKETSEGSIRVNTVDPYDEVLNSGKVDKNTEADQ